MQTKRSFLALFSSAIGMRSLAAAQTDNEPKPLREREVDLRGKHLSLKEYYLELISQDAEVKKRFHELEKELVGEEDSHHHELGTPNVISWVPHSAEFGRAKTHSRERFLILHPLEWAKSRHFWTEGAIFSEFECITTRLEDESGENVVDVTAVYRFFGFRKVTLEPTGP